MRTNFISQSKDDKQKNFWEVLGEKLNLKSSMMKMASKTSIENPREIVKEGLVISYKPNGEYIIKLGHKSDIVVTGVAKQEKELHQHVKRALSYLKSISPAVEAELRTIEAGKRDVLVYVDIDRCRDCVFYESDTSHETYRDKCKNCVNATLGGTINNFFPRSQQIVMYAPQWEQIGDTDPKMAFKGTMSLLDAHKKGSADDRNPEMVAKEIIQSAIMKCPKCGKLIKENTEGDMKYCQGHDMFEPEIEPNALSLGTSLIKYFQANKLNFQTYAKPVIEAIEKQAGVQIHLRKGKDIILAVDSMRLNPTEMTEEEKDSAGEHIKSKLQSGQDLTDEEQGFLDSWLLVYPKKGKPSTMAGKKEDKLDSNKQKADFEAQDTLKDDDETKDFDKQKADFEAQDTWKNIRNRRKASKKEDEAPGALSKCDREALDKYEEAKDNITKSKELMPKGSDFSGTLCLAEVSK